MENRIKLTPEQAIGLLSKKKQIHTFRQSGGFILGADWNRKDLIETINRSESEIGGEQCQRMGHGLVVWDGSPLFVEVDKDKLSELEKQLNEK